MPSCLLTYLEWLAFTKRTTRMPQTPAEPWLSPYSMLFLDDFERGPQLWNCVCKAEYFYLPFLFLHSRSSKWLLFCYLWLLSCLKVTRWILTLSLVCQRGTTTLIMFSSSAIFLGKCQKRGTITLGKISWGKLKRVADRRSRSSVPARNSEWKMCVLKPGVRPYPVTCVSVKRNSPL